MSLYQFAACIDGWNAANASEDAVGAAPSAEEFEQAKKRHGDG